MTPINWFEVLGIFGGGVVALTYVLYRHEKYIVDRALGKESEGEVPPPPSSVSKLDVYRRGRELRSHLSFTGGERRITLEHKQSYESGNCDVRTRFRGISSMFETNHLSLFIAQDFASDLVRMYLELGRSSAGTAAEQRKAYYIGAVYAYKEQLSETSQELRSLLNRLVTTEVRRLVKTDTERAIANLTS